MWPYAEVIDGIYTREFPGNVLFEENAQINNNFQNIMPANLDF